nr:helix-turn-helix domain-containing protein [uncultured Mediterraneibacter sp.]
MNPIAEEIAEYYGMADTVKEEKLSHYGMPRRSGRYPYGSGENPFQHGRDFLGRIADMKKENFTYTDDDGVTYTGEKAIYKSFGLTSSEYRRQVSWARYEKRLLDVETAKGLKADGLGATEIGRKMGIPESTVRSLLNPASEDRMGQAMETVNFLRKQLEEKSMLDVGAGTEISLGIPRTRLDTALDYLEKAEGCPVYGGGIPQPTNTNQQTNQKVLCLPGTEKKEIYDYSKVKTIDDYTSSDGGESYQRKFTYPTSLDSKRLKIRYAEDKGPDGATGLDKDGIIELRPGVQDLSLSGSRYSQVRIMVDGTHYLKGMAVYSNDMPDGVDVIFNTNKKKGTPQTDVLKKIKSDPDNPFGSLIKDADQGGQYWYTDKKTGEKKLGLINKRADEGDWTEWDNVLPSQFLAKQSKTMAQKQLNLAKADKVAEFDEYCKLTNPTIKSHLLMKFADNCDSAAVHLKAAALPGQKYHVIVPINTLKDTEIYAPGYETGTKLALVRYPHGGIFEIPILTVNNKNKLGKEIIGDKSIDAVGINHKIADQLSGADFDGDTVMCIPTHDASGKVKINNKRPLKDLEGFDPKLSYGGTKTVDANGVEHYTRNGQEYPIMKDTQKQMGVISNLITDMTLAGAPDPKIARAVKHSMVVIDAEKHHLDYKASEVENDIASLKKEFQINVDKNGKIKYGGASTLLSRAKGQETVSKRKGDFKTNLPGKDYYDPNRPIGAKLWNNTDDLYYPVRKTNKKTGMIEYTTTDGKKIAFDPKDKKAYERYNAVEVVDKKTGKVRFTDSTGTIEYAVKQRTQKSTRMAETDDAFNLVSQYRHPMELIYAQYANDMKALANKARVEAANAGKIPYSADAKKKYSTEVASLDSKLMEAQKNQPREREALRRANVEIVTKKAADPDMKKDDIKKLKQRSVVKYRSEVGSVARRDRNIEITDSEWEAIQAGAITESKLKKILNNTDIDKLRERATPRLINSPSAAQISRIKALSSSNYTLDEIAKKTGFSTATIYKYLSGKGVKK